MTLLLVLLLVSLAVWLLYIGRAWAAWVLPIAAGLGIWALRSESVGIGWWTCTVLMGVVFLTLGVAPLRRMLVTPRLMSLLAPIFPTMSDTEREALEAGTVWWDT